MKSSLLLATGFFVLAPLVAHAGDIYTNDPQFVVGGAVSRDQSNFDDVINADPSRPANAYVDSSNPATGTNIYAGIRFNPYITARLGYRTFGDFDGDLVYSGVAVGKMRMEAKGLYLAADGMYPLTENFSIGGTLGLQNWNGKMTVSGPGGSYSDDEDARDVFYGARAALKFSETASLVASYDFYSFDVQGESKNLEYNAFALGLELAF